MAWLKYLRRSLAALLLSVLLVAIASWWTAPNWLPPLAAKMAATAGVEIRSIDVGRPDFQGWYVTEITLEAETRRLTARGIQISWRCCREIEKSLSANIERLTIGAVQDKSGVEPAPVALTALLNNIAQRIPFLKLTVQEVVGPFTRIPPVSLELTRQENVLQAKVTLLPAVSQVSRESLQFPLLQGQIQWDAPARLTVNLQQGVSGMNLAAELNSLGQWQLTGRYSLKLREMLLADAEMYRLAAPVPLDQFDQLNLSGTIQAELPDVLGFGRWRAVVRNTADLHLTKPISLSLNSEQLLELDGNQSVDSLHLPSLQVNGFVDGTTKVPYLPRSWLMELSDPLRCSLKSNYDQQAFQAGASWTPVDIYSCLRRVALRATSLDVDASVPSFSILAFLDLSSVWEQTGVGIDAEILGDGRNLPQKMLFNTAFSWLHAEHRIRSNQPLAFDWQGWHGDIAPALAGSFTEGSLHLENWQLNGLEGPAPLLAADLILTSELRGKVHDAPLEVIGSGTFSQEAVELKKGVLSFLDLGLNTEAKMDLSQSKGWISFAGAGAPTSGEWLGAWLPGDSEITIEPGELAITSFINLGWDSAFSVNGRSQFQLGDWRLQQGERFWKGINVQGDVNFGLDSLRLQKPLQVRIKEADIGIPLANIAANLEGKLGFGDKLRCDLQLQSASMELFDGMAQLTEPSPLNCVNEDIRMPITIQNFDLAKLVALESEKIDASGRISGTLPVRIAKGKVIVEDGQGAAQSPGHIKLRDKSYWQSIAGVNPQLGEVLQILENFEYDALSMVVNFDDREQLQLNTRLLGSNPAFKKGKKVDFNLNVESNIIELLRSATLPQEIERRIQRAYNR